MRPPKKKAAKKKPSVRLSPASRFEELKLLLRSGWIAPADVMERLGISRATAFRLVAALEKTEPLERETIEGKLRWRLPRETHVSLRISTSQMVALSFVRNALGFLRGTGLDDDLGEVFDQLALALKKSDFELSKDLDRKLYDMNEAAYDYSDKIDVVNDVVTALLWNQELSLTQKDGTVTKVDPYTLVLYKKGIYLSCRSHARDAIRTFGLDKVVDTERHTGNRFDYPDAWRPDEYHGEPWGMMRGERTRVVVRFDAKVEWFVTRRKWHKSQTFTQDDGKLVFTAEPHGLEEMVSWVLGFGGNAEVLEPPAFRARVAEELKRAAVRY